MSKGIIKITPKGGNSGSLEITEADPNPYKVVKGSILSFAAPGFDTPVGSSVSCDITSSKTCKVTGID
jgi:hypothetical protein